MNHFLSSLSYFVDQFYQFEIDSQLAFIALRDSLSTGQTMSKHKLIETCRALDIKSKNAVFIGHWHGLLPFMMNRENFIQAAVGIEKDKIWSDFSNYLNRDWNWISKNLAIEDYKYDLNTDLIANTSCEHMTDGWLRDVPSGCLLILQTTNFIHHEHINIQQTLAQFLATLSGFEIQFSDELDCDVYKRFTVVCKKK